ncbi:hypothetical protein ABG067_009394, partial [Albugo candida]
MVPSWSEWLIRKEEYKLKKVWLERMVGNHKQFVARSEAQVLDHSDLTEGLCQKMWNARLNSEHEAAEALQL